MVPGREHYCPILARQLDRFWPGHPPLYYALPAGRSAPYERVIPTDADTWTGVLRDGLRHLRELLGATRAFILLEDHVPLRPCDPALLAEYLDIAESEDLPCLFFPKWEWPWDNTRYRLDPDNRVIGWRKIDYVTVRGRRLARMPADFFRYNMCQPSVWKIDYHLELLQEAIHRGITDPWRFEAFVMPSQPQHYVADYRWPSRMSGYRREGKIYWRALYTIKLPEGQELLDELLRERFPRLPRFLRVWLRETLHAWGRLRRISSRYEGRPR